MSDKRTFFDGRPLPAVAPNSRGRKGHGHFSEQARARANRAGGGTGFQISGATQMVSNGEFNPLPQTRDQRKVEERLKDLAEPAEQARFGPASVPAHHLRHGRCLRGDERRLWAALQGRSGRGERTRGRCRPRRVVVRDSSSSTISCISCATTIRSKAFLDSRTMPRDNWNPAMKTRAHRHGARSLKFDNFVKEIYLDSDTTVGLLSGAPFDDPTKWFLSNDQMKAASESLNSVAGSRRLLFHSLITPQTARLDGRSRSGDRGGEADQLEVVYDRRSAEPGNHEVSVAAGR